MAADPHLGSPWRRVAAGAGKLRRSAAGWWARAGLPALAGLGARGRGFLAWSGPSARRLAACAAVTRLRIGSATGRGLALLRVALARLVSVARRGAARGARRLGVLGAYLAALSGRIGGGAFPPAVRRLAPGPVLAALPSAAVGSALAGELTRGGLVRGVLGVAALAVGAWLAGACLAAGFHEAKASAWFRSAAAVGAGLALGATAHGLACRFTPSSTSWVAACACLVALGLGGSRVLPEAHLLWAGPLALLPRLGWEAAGGAVAEAPLAVTGWALLLAGGHALVWAADQPGSERYGAPRLAAARLCHRVSPFPLLALVATRPVGMAFVAGIVAANLLHQGGHLLADRAGSPPRRGLPWALGLGALALSMGILADAAGFPR